jgi:type I restriction enzyme S subunit
MAQLDATTAVTGPGVERPFGEVQKGYTVFRNRDILVAKITPCFENGKVGQATISHDIGVGSTEFHVVRPDASSLDDRYLLHFLRQRRVRVEGERRMTGSAGQKRVPATFLAQLRVPLPPLSEQRRIAEILDQADALRAKRRQTLALHDDLTQAVFGDMFGDLDALTRAPVVARLGDLVQASQLGLVRAAKEFGAAGEYPYIRMNSITSAGRLDLRSCQRTDATAAEAAKYAVSDGDLLFNTRNSRELVGKSAVYRGPRSCLFNNNLLRVRFKPSVHVDYVHQLLNSPYGRQQLETRKSGTTSVFAIYYKDLATLPVPIPPVPLQQRFHEFLAGLSRMRTSTENAHRRLDEVFATLQATAFCGPHDGLGRRGMV